MKILSIDVGGSGVKILATGETERRRMDSGPTMTPQMMVDGVKQLAGDWQYELVFGGGSAKKLKTLPGPLPTGGRRQCTAGRIYGLG